MLKLYDKPFISPEGYDLYDNAQEYVIGPKALADKVARNYYDNPDKYNIKNFDDWWYYIVNNLPFEQPSQDDDNAVDEWLNEIFNNDDNVQYLKYLYTSGPYQDALDSPLKHAYGSNILDSDGNDVTAESYDDYADYNTAIDRYYAEDYDVNGDGDTDVILEDYDDDGNYDYAEINADDSDELKDAGNKVNDMINNETAITSTGKTKKELSEDDVDNSNIINALKDLRF